MSSSVKQVKISTSILWLLNKAQARGVFFSSSDIFSEKTNLHLHSLIIRGLISAELYSAALSKLFPNVYKVARTKDFQAIIDFLSELDTAHVEEVAILRQKDKVRQLEALQRQNPFEISEHLQMIDAIMAVNLVQSDVVLSIPTILGKLCDFRPTATEPKKLLEIWFKSISCLSLSRKNIKDLHPLIQSIITEKNLTNDADNRYLENVKFSDKIALIISYDGDFIGVDKDFMFEYGLDGSAERNNVKHNFMSVLGIFRKKFPKVLEDFKEMMLILNSSHVQISSNMLINIDVFMLEFFTSIDEFSNHGNRTFRTGLTILGNKEKNDVIGSLIKKGEKHGSSNDKLGSYVSQTMNKPPANFKDQFSKPSAFGTYSGRRGVPIDLEDPQTKENSVIWDSNLSGSSILNGPRKKSLPTALDGTKYNRMVNSEVILSDGSLKSMFIERRNQKEDVDQNKTSWLEQSEKSFKSNNESSNRISTEQENIGPRVKVNETRLRLNMKRQEIERNRHEQQKQSAKEAQLISEQAFKDVALKSGRNEVIEDVSYRQTRVRDLKRHKGNARGRELVRSQSQDLSRHSVDDISASLNQLKSEINKLTTEQAKLTAKLESQRVNDTESFSPRTEPSGMSRDYDIRSSTRSQPPSWNARSPYNNEQQAQDRYQSLPSQYQYQHYYQYDPSNPQFYHYPVENFQYYRPMAYPATYSQPIAARGMAKSVQDSITSRVTSPVAMSEPVKQYDEVLSPKQDPVVKEEQLLTVNNLTKHNESMEVIAQPSVSQEWIKTVSSDDVQVMTEELKSEGKSIEDLPKENGGTQALECSDDLAQAFYVSFNDDPPNGAKKLPQKPTKLASRPPISKRNNKPENVPSPSNGTGINSEVGVNKVQIKEKPVAFVIAVDDDISPKVADSESTLVKEKLAHMSEKREQERKQKLEKARELAKCEIEKRLEKEMEKEKIKQDKEMKRKAIFEAYLEKKVDNEVNDKSSRRETRVPKRLNRAVSAAPLQRTEPDQIIDANFLSSLSPSELPNVNSKADKVPVTPSNTKLFVAPKAKSNKGVILNAIKYCCLAGKVNEGLKQQTIEDLDKCEVPHLMVLMRGGCQYRSLYGFNPETEVLVKISGMGPKKITSKMVERFYKYSSGSKKFIEIDSTSHLSTVIDGITIYNTLWKSTMVPCGQLMSSETSSVADQVSQ